MTKHSNQPQIHDKKKTQRILTRHTPAIRLQPLLLINIENLI